MIVQNLLQVPDTYGEPFVSLSAMPISLFVFNNAIRITVLKKNPGGGLDWEKMPEQVIAPGSCQITGAVGFFVKNNNPGNIAIISFAIPEFQKESPDPSIVGFTPTTVTVSASGGITQLGVIDHSANTIDVVADASEQDLYNFVIPAGTVAATGMLRLFMMGDFLHNNVAGDTIIIRIKLGGVTLWQPLPSSLGNVISGRRQPWHFELCISNQSVVNSQFFSLQTHIPFPDAAAPTVGIGPLDIGGQSIVHGQGGAAGLAAIDMSVAERLQVTAQWGTASGSNSWRKRYAILENL